MGLLIICFGILTRLIPHLPNFSPEIVFALYLGMKYSKALALLMILLIAAISDLLLGWGFGSWALFTYSALLTIGWIGMCSKNHYGKKFIINAGGVTVAYWLWTNFGVWLIENIYPHTLTGFIACYSMALPFLTNSLMASIAWSIIIILCENYLLPFGKKQIKLMSI